MIDQAVAIYCICDELCKFLNLRDDPQCRMSTAEVMCFAMLSATIFGCDYRHTRLIAKHQRLFTKILSHSQLVRRIHAVPEHVWRLTFLSLQFLLRDKSRQSFAVDSFPVKAYENHKSFRARIFREKEYHGYSSSRKQYFFGIKVHMIVDEDGVPIEFSFTPGSTSDIGAFRNMELGLPDGAIIWADRAYTDYDFEDYLLDIENVRLIARRKANSKRPHLPEINFQLGIKRNRIETVFSSITGRMPRHLKARTERGFYLKIVFFILAYMVQLFHPLD